MGKRNHEKELLEVAKRTDPIIRRINSSVMVGAGQRMDILASFKCEQGEGLQMTKFEVEIKNQELKRQMDNAPQFAAFVNSIINETLDCARAAQSKYSKTIAHAIKQQSKKMG